MIDLTIAKTIAEQIGHKACILSYGGGRNSTALLIALVGRGIRPDAILFADTGGEKPETYAYLWQHVQPWCAARHLTITIVRWRSEKWQTLEEQCLVTKRLPSRVFGFSQCSQRWKIEPQQRWVKTRYGKQPITWVIGIHADEDRKLAADTEQYRYWYPLREWEIGQEECGTIILRAGLPLPPKSACFFCPSSKKHEILALPPDLRERALAIERTGTWESDAIKGLGRRFAWADLLEADEAQQKLFPDPPKQDCVCED